MSHRSFIVFIGFFFYIVINAQNVYRNEPYSGNSIKITTSSPNRRLQTRTRNLSISSSTKDRKNSADYSTGIKDMKHDTLFFPNRYVVKTTWKESCYLCKGTGICSSCNGSGYFFFERLPPVQCGSCTLNSTLGKAAIGRCKECLGSGMRNYESGVCYPNGGNYLKVTANGYVVYFDSNFPKDQNASNSSNSQVSNNSKKSHSRRDCYRCNGLGYYEDPRWSVPNFTGEKYYAECSNCLRMIDTDSHHTCICRVCNGNGYIENK